MVGINKGAKGNGGGGEGCIGCGGGRRKRRAHLVSSSIAFFWDHFRMRQKRPLRRLRLPSGPNATKTRPFLGLYFCISDRILILITEDW